MFDEHDPKADHSLFQLMRDNFPILWRTEHKMEEGEDPQYPFKLEKLQALE